jgi:hypothetical protein
MRIVSLLISLLGFTLVLSGCGIGSAVKAGYNLVATPSISECYQMRGKTLAQVEETFGKPVRVKELKVQDPPGSLPAKLSYQLTYTKGAMTLVVEVNNINPDEVVLSVDCTKH